MRGHRIPSDPIELHKPTIGPTDDVLIAHPQAAMEGVYGSAFTEEERKAIVQEYEDREHGIAALEHIRAGSKGPCFRKRDRRTMSMQPCSLDCADGVLPLGEMCGTCRDRHFLATRGLT